MRVCNLTITFALLATAIACEKDVPNPTSSDAPIVLTGTASKVTDREATISGEIAPDGKEVIIARGIVYATFPGPTTASTIASAGTGTGVYTVTMTDLLPGTTYYARAFAINMVGTYYGSEINFVTTASGVTVKTKEVTNITPGTAESGGDVTSEGSAAVTARGICWSTAASPTIADDKTVDGEGAGSFVSSMTGLASGTVYYVRAYATSEGGTAYGLQQSFTTVQDPACFYSLAGPVSYVTVVSSARRRIDGCLPSISGTTLITLLSPGLYTLGDPTFGEYRCVYGVNPGNIRWETTCFNVSTTGTSWAYSVVSNDGTTLVLRWWDIYGDVWDPGDEGTSYLTRAGGWPLNLTF